MKTSPFGFSSNEEKPKKCYTESKDLRDKDNESHISSNWGFIFSTLNSSGALYAFDG